MANAYYVNELTGGGATSLDFIDGTGISQNDFAFALVNDIEYIYILDDDSAAAENSPYIIMPDTNAGDKRWVLQPYATSTTSNKGVVELATSAETLTGTNASRATTPAGVQAKITDAAIEIATDTEAEAKLVTDKALVPSNLAAIFLDEDAMTSNSNTKICSQQSIVAYVDTVRDVPTGEKVLFYKDTAVTGYSLLDTLDDKVIYVTKGSVAGGETGGAVHSSGAWTHTHTYTDIVSHLHSVDPPLTTSASNGSHGHTIRRYSSGGAAGTCVDHASDTYADVSGVVNAVGNHTHAIDIAAFDSASTGSAEGTTAAQTAWRPAAYNFTMQERI